MQIQPSMYVIGILVFTFVIMSGMALIGELHISDSTFATGGEFESFNNTFNVYNDVQGSVSDLKQGVTNSSGYGIFDPINSLVSTGWNTMRLTVTSFGFMDAVFRGLTLWGHVPAFVGEIIISIIVVMLVFALFSAIFMRQYL